MSKVVYFVQQHKLNRFEKQLRCKHDFSVLAKDWRGRTVAIRCSTCGSKSLENKLGSRY